MICILCVYVKHHMITEPKNSLAVPSGRFLSKFVQTFVCMAFTAIESNMLRGVCLLLNMPTEFRSDRPPVTF